MPLMSTSSFNRLFILIQQLKTSYHTLALPQDLQLNAGC